MFNILVVEDDIHARKLMVTVLQQNNFHTLAATDGEAALELMDHQMVDLVITDIMMPKMDGYELVKTLREGGSQIPVLMITAKESIQDKKKGFLGGTDDYMVKPIDEEEMVLRVQALLRRSAIVNAHRLTVGKVILDYDAYSVQIGDKAPQTLPQKEFLLLYQLLSYQNKIFTRRQLMDEIWDMDSETDERTVDVHINRLRDRFRDLDDFEIVTVRGLGYKAVQKN